MKLHELRSPAGARQESRRVGRGTGSGRGKTSGRGQKGQLARSEGFRLGFEGGQMPLAQRLPKLGGFKNPFKKRYAVINLTKLNRFKDGTEVTEALIWEAGLARLGEDVKVLGTGKLGRKLKSVEAHAFSESARAALEAKGAKIVLLEEISSQPAGEVAAKRPAEAAEAAEAAEPADTAEPAEPAESAEPEESTSEE